MAPSMGRFQLYPFVEVVLTIIYSVSYFTCAPKCGVFVASAKLSLPISRPPSVASSHGRTTPSLPPVSGRRTPSVNGRVTPARSASGRATPAFSASGRATPVYGSGRVTPARPPGRVTPSFTTPSARPRVSIAPAGATPGAKPRKSAVVEPSFTAGSRASRYIGMTAQQLQNAKSGINNGSEARLSSPTQASAPPPPSPFATPKPPTSGRVSGIGVPTPGGVKGRQSAGGFGFGTGTPRSARRTDMPPPSSPVSPSKRLLASSPSMKLSMPPSPSRRLITPTSPSRKITTPTGSEFSVDRDDKSDYATDLEVRNKELQERIANLMNGKPVNGVTPSVPPSSVSPDDMQRSTVDNTALEAETARATAALTRVSELETQVRFHERAVKERESRIDAIERSLRGKDEEVDKARAEGEARVRELTGKLEDSDSLVTSLKAAVEEVRAGKKEETEAIIGAKDKEIELLGAKVVRAVTELEDDRRELGSQIDELRQAGQVKYPL